MMLFVVMIGLLGSEAWVVGSNRIVDSVNQGVGEWQFLGPDGAVRRQLPGRVVSVGAEGCLVAQLPEGPWSWFDYRKGQSSVLPKPSELPSGLQADLRNLIQPAFLTQQALMVWAGSSWRSFALPMWFETLEPRPLPGSAYGLDVVVPFLFGNTSLIWAYQAKKGSFWVFDLKTGATQKHQVSEKMVPVFLEKVLLWVNAPEKGRLGLNQTGSAFGITNHLDIPHLSQRSWVLPLREGAWFLTFSDDFGDAKAAWGSGLVAVEATYVAVQSGQLTQARVSLGSLPVVFNLAASPSGSPKLQVEPGFRVLPVEGSQRAAMAVCLAKSIYWVEPRGPIKKLAHKVALDAVWAVQSKEQGLLLQTASGPVVITHKGGLP